MSTVDGKVELIASGIVNGEPRELTGLGNGPIDAFVHALSNVDIAVRVLDWYGAGGIHRPVSLATAELAPAGDLLR